MFICAYLALTLNFILSTQSYIAPLDPGLYNKTTPEMITRDGYPVEVHYITTSDGYILGVHRIPYANIWSESTTPKPVVILHHGIAASSAIWFMNSPGKILPYLLAESGFDVWLANARGNLYSRNHTYLSPDEKQFWDYSLQEIALCDLPALIDYILAETRQAKLSFIGQSLGNTVYFMLASGLPAYNDKISVSIALAPIAFSNHMASPIAQLLAPVVRKPGKHTDEIVDFFTAGKGEFAPNDAQWQQLAITACAPFISAYAICSLPVFTAFGFDYGQLDASMLNDIWGHYPQGISANTFVHYGQFYNTGRFCFYDYGIEKNQQLYNADTPPDFPLEYISAPLYIMAGPNDLLSRPEDLDQLQARLTGVDEVLIYVDYPEFNHMDFIFAIDVDVYVHRPVLDILNVYKGTK